MARPRSKAVLLSAVSLAALAGLGMVATKLATEHRIAQAATTAGVGIAGIDTNPLTGRVTLTGISFALGDAAVVIGGVSSSAGPALVSTAQAAGDVTLENITVTLGPIRYVIPRIDVAGSSLDRAGLQAVFDASNSSEPLAARLAKLAASSLTIPELKFEQNIAFGGVQTKATGNYTNLVARDIMNGRAAMLTGDGGSYTTIATTEPPAPGAPPAGTDTQAKPPAPATATTTGRYGTFSVKDLDYAFLTRLYTEAAGAGPNPPVQVYGPFTMANMNVTESNGTKVDIKEVSGDGFVARLGAKPLLSMVETLQKLPMDDAHKEQSSFQILSEAISMLDSLVSGSMVAKTISVETPGPEPVKLNVGNVTAGFSRDPMPQTTNPAYPAQGGTRFAVNDIAFSLPPNSDNDLAKRLIAMGYKDLSLSFTLEGRLNEAGKELVINEFSFGGRNMGKAAISAILGNVTPELLSSEEAVRNAAGMALTVKNLAIRVDNSGLADKLLAAEAARQNKSAEALKTEYSMIATVGVPGFLGGGSDSKALGTAISRFIAKPGQLAVKAVAKDPAGFGLADYGATGGQPAAILEQLTISAEAK